MNIPIRHGVIKELLVFFLTSTPFIVAYAYFFSKPLDVIAQHLFVIVVTLISIYTFEAAYLLANFKTRFINKFHIFISAVLIFLLLTYYFMVFISLSTWGKVITIELINTYCAQFIAFLNIFKISLSVVIGLSILAFGIVYYACYRLFSNHIWIKQEKHNKSKITTLLAFSISLFCFNWLFNYYDSPPKFNDEPIYLTLHSGKLKGYHHQAQGGWSVEPNAQIDEDEAIKAYKPNQYSKKPNIIVFLSDALRPDHMGVYGYKRNTTPNITRFAETQKAILYKNIRSTCAETACAHASLFASRYPNQIPNNPLSLQKILKMHGYKIQFIISGDHINFNNIRSIYGNEVDHYFDATMVKNYYINDDRMIIEHSKSLPVWNRQPTFIHYHLLSNHVLGYRMPPFEIYNPHSPYTAISTDKKNPAYVNHYDNGVLQMDNVIKQLTETLKSKYYLEDAIVIVISDHGESLGEHDMLGHTNSVYEQAIHIPLIFFQFGNQYSLGKQPDKFGSMIDIAPSILNALDMPIPAIWKGIPLQLEQQHEQIQFEMYPYAGFYQHINKNQIMKYWRHSRTQEESLFNITDDYKESRNEIWKINDTFRRNLRQSYQQKYERNTE